MDDHTLAADSAPQLSHPSFLKALQIELLARLDGILMGSGVIFIILMVLLVVRAKQLDARDACMEALKSSRNGVVIMQLCGK